jgi:hypothetical protein
VAAVDGREYHAEAYRHSTAWLRGTPQYGGVSAPAYPRETIRKKDTTVSADNQSGGGNGELVLQGQTNDIAIYRAPETILAEAHKAAVALQDVIKNKKDPVMMNGQQYLEYEDWQTVGRFYGITAKVESVEYVSYGSVRGFSASAVALRADGFELSRATGDCLSDEPKWATKPKYEWRDKEGGGGREKVQVGEENVPLFQLKSMAQTRACAKALRNVLAWVVVLAGYRATPAEAAAEEGRAKAAAVPLRRSPSALGARKACRARARPLQLQAASLKAPRRSRT